MNNKQLNWALNRLSVGNTFNTHGKPKGITYTISNISLDNIQISLNSANQAVISKQAFFAVNDYLQNNGHDINKPIAEASSNLCHTAKLQNSNAVCIHYIIPILNQLGCIDCSDTRPNTCWYIAFSSKPNT